MSGENYNIKLQDDGASGGNYNVKVKDGASGQQQTAQRTRNCDVCKTTIILDKNRFCTDCRMYMCDRCILPHSKFPSTASHTLSADDLKTPEAPAQISNPGSTEGTIRLRLQNVGQVEECQDYCSEETTIADIPWCLQAGRSGFGDKLLVWLYCDRHGTLSRSEFSVDVEFSVSVLHPDAGKTLTEKRDYTFSRNKRRWGAYFCDWKDLARHGFITDDSITVEAEVKVKSVRGVPA